MKRTVLCAHLALGWLVGAGVVSVAPQAIAQSAADKATARKLATEGIKLFQQQKYDEALDKLKRAEALYDAPIHLLYMARCQVQLGKLVEGAESYRRLVRTELDDKAPDVFRSAVADGEKELAEVEPRIPSLTINVEPSSTAGLQIKLDGEPVSVAVLGVERPVNPGERVVVAEAPGYLPAEGSATVAEGQSEQVSLTLQVDPNAPKEPVVAPGTEGQTTEGGTVPITQNTEEDWRTKEIDPSAVGFFVGLSAGGLFPSGNLQKVRVEDKLEDVPTSDYMGIGGGAELHGGVRFLRNFGVKLFFERYALLPGPELDESGSLMEGDQFEVVSTANATSFGFSAMAGTPRGRIGGYGELGLALTHQYGWDRDIVDTVPNEEPDFSPCTEKMRFSGAAFVIGGSFVFPVHPNIQLTASGRVTLGSFTKYHFESNCSFQTQGKNVEGDVANTSLHQQFFLGAGADFLFGSG